MYNKIGEKQRKNRLYKKKKGSQEVLCLLRMIDRAHFTWPLKL